MIRVCSLCVAALLGLSWVAQQPGDADPGRSCGDEALVQLDLNQVVSRYYERSHRKPESKPGTAIIDSRKRGATSSIRSGEARAKV